jgi:hypothetical protein
MKVDAALERASTRTWIFLSCPSPLAEHRYHSLTPEVTPKSPYSGVREKTGPVKRWRDGRMALRCTTSALLSIEKRMRRLMGYRQLWMLNAALNDLDEKESVVVKEKVA